MSDRYENVSQATSCRQVMIVGDSVGREILQGLCEIASLLALSVCK